MSKDAARLHIEFQGRVQGVGFRWTAMQAAESLGLTGWVRNLDNGDVACEVQGAPFKIDEFIGRMMNEKSWIVIDNYTAEKMPVKPAETKFGVKY